MYTKYTKPTTKSCKRHRTANATDSTTYVYCTDTASRTDRADRLSPLVKATDTNTDSNSANVCTPVDLDIGMDTGVIVNLPGMSSQSADTMADMEAVIMHADTKPLLLSATWPQ